MALIRVGLIGLSASRKTCWAAIAHLPYLTSAQGKVQYEIVALLNSSKKAGEAAKEYYKLSSSVKTYDDPSALAADPDVDLVVCSVRVDLHFDSVEPSVKAGKEIFVEWPLAHNLDKATKLQSHSQNDGGAIGLQRRLSPIIVKVNELVQSGRIGQVLSSSFSSFNTMQPRDSIPEVYQYIAKKHVGGNLVTIFYGHMVDYVHQILGDFSTLDSRMQIQRPAMNIVRADGSKVQTITMETPDLINVHATLAGSKPNVTSGATLALSIRHGPPFKGHTPLTWSINGENGEILVSSTRGPFLETEPADTTIQIHDHQSDEVTNVPWDYADWQKELPMSARNMGAIYERYARWVENGKPTAEGNGKDAWPRLQDAIPLHQEIDTLFKQFEAQRKA